MEKMRKNTIAALEKQVGLLNKDGTAPAETEAAIRAISVLTGLLAVLEAKEQQKPKFVPETSEGPCSGPMVEGFTTS